jgi:hypothetical protein
MKMTACGVSRIDDLVTGKNGVGALAAGDADREAIGVVQDLLAGHGFKGLPGLLASSRGLYGPTTTRCMEEFQQRHGLAKSGTVDHPTIRKLVDQPAVMPIASRGYLTLVLDMQYVPMTRIMSVTTQFEGAGRFGAVNRNTDRQGLSFGLIQWAQRPGRLIELLKAFQRSDAERFVAIFGDGDSGLAQRLLSHGARVNGGVDSQGRTTDPEFDLVDEPWLSRFREAALTPRFQRAQAELAIQAFKASHMKLASYAPQLKSERAIAFMLDVANQHGDGGARSIYHAVGGRDAFVEEAALLAAIEHESVARVRAQFGDDSNEARSTASRRSAFRTTPLLSDDPLSPA